MTHLSKFLREIPKFHRANGHRFWVETKRLSMYFRVQSRGIFYKDSLYMADVLTIADHMEHPERKSRRKGLFRTAIRSLMAVCKSRGYDFLFFETADERSTEILLALGWLPYGKQEKCFIYELT